MIRPAPLELSTERLSLRAPDIRHAVDIMTLANDRRVADMLARMPHPYTYADALAWIGIVRANGNSPNSCMFGVFAGPRRDRFAGACSIHPLGFGGEPHLGYWFGAPYWGQGYALEAARAVLDHAFDTLKLPAVLSGAQVRNSYSRVVLERLGFRHLGVRIIHSCSRGSADYVDAFHLTREDWRRAA